MLNLTSIVDAEFRPGQPTRAQLLQAYRIAYEDAKKQGSFAAAMVLRQRLVSLERQALEQPMSETVE
jgi:hypothetical protein